MKICHIITGLHDGGAEAVLFQLCQHDNLHNHVVISMMDEAKYGPLLKEKGIRVHCLDMDRGKIKLSSMIKLYKLLRTEKPDTVQCWMYHSDLIGGLVARIAGVKNIYWGLHHTTLEPGQSASSTILVAKVCAKVSRWVPKKIVCCADKSAEVHAKIGYAPNKFVVVHNGYDISRFSPNLEKRTALRKELNIRSNSLLLGMVARFNPQKDHENLIRAVSILNSKGRDISCILVGDDMDENNNKLMTWLNKYDVRQCVKLLGPRSDIPDLMNALDVFVLSSSFGEAFPNVIAEAMACGTPCVATNIGDTAKIIGNTGWVVEPRNSEELANSIMYAMDEKLNSETSWQDRKSLASDRIVQNFSISKMIKSFHEVWVS